MTDTSTSTTPEAKGTVYRLQALDEEQKEIPGIEGAVTICSMENVLIAECSDAVADGQIHTFRNSLAQAFPDKEVFVIKGGAVKFVRLTPITP